MGVTTASNASAETMAANIKKINTGGMELIGFHAANLRGTTGAADYMISEDLTGYERVYVLTFWARNQSGFSGLIYGGYPTATFSNCTATRVSGTESSDETNRGSIVTLLTNITGTVKMTNVFYGNSSGDGYVILFGEPK